MQEIRNMAAAIIIKGNKILLVHNTKHNSLRIEPPGGKKEEFEIFEECAVRETMEELGISIKVKNLFGVYGTDSPEGRFEVHMFLSEITGGEISLKEKDKISDYSWYSYNDLKELASKKILVPNMCSAMPELLKLLNG